jgi:hypothetical protein
MEDEGVMEIDIAKLESLTSAEEVGLASQINDLLQEAVAEGIPIDSRDGIDSSSAGGPTHYGKYDRFFTWLQRRNEKIEAMRRQYEIERSIDPECTFSPSLPSVSFNLPRFLHGSRFFLTFRVFLL